MEIQLWREVLSPYELAVQELTVKFEHLMKEYKEQVCTRPLTGDRRVKSISSILQKAQKKNIPLDRIQEEMYDIAGVRIICQFVEDIEMVVEMIRKRSDMKIVDERDYVSHVKDSGYRSYHLIVAYEVETMSGTQNICVEIQVRTLGMNFWAIIEHSLQYKYQKNMPEHIRKKIAEGGPGHCGAGQPAFCCAGGDHGRPELFPVPDQYDRGYIKQYSESVSYRQQKGDCQDTG